MLDKTLFPNSRMLWVFAARGGGGVGAGSALFPGGSGAGSGRVPLQVPGGMRNVADFTLHALRSMDHAWRFTTHAACFRVQAARRMIYALECRIYLQAL